MQKELSTLVQTKAKKAGHITGIAVTFGLLGATTAFAQEQCQAYTVVRGDTLSKIASSADVEGGYRTLFQANTATLTNPNRLEVGQVLQIPCANDPAATSSVSVASVATAAPEKRPLRIITGSGYAPFTDEGLEGGGALTQMVYQAVMQGDPDQEFSIDFVNDWGAHLDSLLPTGGMDMTFPWFRPDCSKVEFLSAASAARCTEFNHSEPLYDALVGFYTLTGSEYADATTYAELRGSRICRPEAWFTFDLEAEQLMPPNVELIRPVPQNGCWELLLDGKVDVITLDALPAEEDYREAGLEGQIAHIEALTSKQTMHVFVDKDNAFANAALPIINAGLEDLRMSGEWFEIVNAGILETMDN